CDDIRSNEKNRHYIDDDNLKTMNELEDDMNGSAEFIVQDVVQNGMTNTSTQDEVKLLIREEKINMCAVVETQNYGWWESNTIGANLISQSDQVMHFELNFIHDHRKQFISFVYANNFERDRKPLWDNLMQHEGLVNSEPWVALGDFNVALNVEDCSNYFSVIDKDMEVFRRCLESLDLEDIYPEINAQKPKSFRFLNFFMDKENFLPTVRNKWNIEVKGFCMFVLAEKLKNMKRYIRNLNRLNVNVFDKVKALRVELKRVQQCLDKEPENVHLKEEEYVYCNAYRDIGGVNKSRIEVVYDEAGNKFEGDEVPTQFCALNMVRAVVDYEIKDAMFSIDDDKATGPDGFTLKIFKSAWSVVGSDVCAAVKEFFSSGKILGEFNTKLISLIPRLQTSLKVIDYRPIAGCNMIYKCISKVITNRLKEGLSELIDPNESAFIPDRQISDNILLS
ncbi:RNA-directed DNA polymerase, eukaryota, reverse transcriptase zinc-binding domain protein, partial [Tanacetum coccineum]